MTIILLGICQIVAAYNIYLLHMRIRVLELKAERDELRREKGII